MNSFDGSPCRSLIPASECVAMIPRQNGNFKFIRSNQYTTVADPSTSNVQLGNMVTVAICSIYARIGPQVLPLVGDAGDLSPVRVHSLLKESFWYPQMMDIVITVHAISFSMLNQMNIWITIVQLVVTTLYKYSIFLLLLTNNKQFSTLRLLGVWGLGFGVWGLGFGVWEIGRAHV